VDTVRFRAAVKTKRLHTLFRRLLIVFAIVNSAAIVVAVNSSSTSWSNRFVALAVIAGVGTGLMFIGLMLTKTKPA
jgi:archaellum biogenesis protein FlaJ (TadC family)